MYQNLVESREVPWRRLVKDMPKSKHHDLDFIVDQLDWDKNVDPNFKDHHYLEPVPVADTRKEGFVDRWIVYGKVDGEQLFIATELTVNPDAPAMGASREEKSNCSPDGRAPSNNLNLTRESALRAGRFFATQTS